jgi:hypothetical protein
MRLATKTLIALGGVIAAMSLGASSPAPAQGFYFNGPGVEFGIGAPYYHHRYYRHYGYSPYAYRGSYPYWRYHRYRQWDWD